MVAVVIALGTAWQTGTGCFMSIGSLAARAGIAKKKTVRECLAHLVDEQLIEQHDVNDIHEDWFHLPCNKTQGYFYTIKLAGYPRYDVTQPMPAEVRELLAQTSGYISPSSKGAKMDPPSNKGPKKVNGKGAKMDPPKSRDRGPFLEGSILAPSKSDPDQGSFHQENLHQERKEEEEVVQGSIDDASDIDGETPPLPDLILEHQGTPLAAREGILPAKDENKETLHNVEENADAKLQEWVAGKLKSFGASIGDSKGVTELRVKLLMSQLAQVCPEADHRTVCEWLKRRLANFAARTFEDRGPNPPNSIHQALEWLETDLSEGSLARFHESKRAEQHSKSSTRSTPSTSCTTVDYEEYERKRQERLARAKAAFANQEEVGK